MFTGGGAKLPRLADFAKKELKLPSRIGMPHRVLVSETKPELLGVMGLIVVSADSEGEASGNGLLSRLWNKAKKMFKSFIP